MDAKSIMQVFSDTAYVRTGGSPEELKTANYLLSRLEQWGVSGTLEAFDVDMADILEAEFTVDGKTVPCKGYKNAGSGEVEAELYYLRNTDDYSLSRCKGKIVMIDGYLGYWRYQDLLSNGALGFVTYDGNANYSDRDIDQRELRSYVSKGVKIPGVNINAKDAIAIIRDGGKTAKITLKQNEYEGQSHNVILDLPGEGEDYIVFTAHYDSTSLSQGAYDNMSGSVGLLGLAEYFVSHPHRCGLRFVWCGSEERGLLGSKAYCAAHEEALKSIVLNINLDMIGCIMGKFISCCTGEEKLCHYISYMASELGFGMETAQDVYSSDSTPFADKGIPAVSFARSAPSNTATIHNSYDTMALMSGEQMVADIDFSDRLYRPHGQRQALPRGKRDAGEHGQEKLDEYLCRKRPEKK